jgi:hypothetical protein
MFCRSLCSFQSVSVYLQSKAVGMFSPKRILVKIIALLLKKEEELTLYIIAQDKRLTQLEKLNTGKQ